MGLANLSRILPGLGETIMGLVTPEFRWAVLK